MRLSLSKTSLLSMSLVLSGCCNFMPCHPATYMSGTVTDATSGQTIPDASVRLYHYAASTASSGCFSLRGADALPFEFGVTAPGYKPLVVKAVSGTYQATVTLAPVGSTGEGTSQVREISEDKYAELSRGCPYQFIQADAASRHGLIQALGGTDEER